MEDEYKTIYTKSGEPIKWLARSADSYLDKTTLIFGGSGSGKTTIIEEILFLCSKHIPNYIVVAPRTSDKAYRSKFKNEDIANRCIKEDLTKKKLQTIWQRQYYITQLYNTANDINVLESLFAKAPDKEIFVMIQAILKRATDKNSEIQKSSILNYAQKKSQTSNIKELCAKKIKFLYKKSIRQNKEILYSKSISNTLTDKEKVALEYLDINPRLMIIIDDSTEKFQSWMKLFKKGEVNPFESIFYKGRWNYITLLFAAHDDKIIVPELRKNARITYYTTSQALVASLNKAQSGFTTQEKKFAQRCAEVLFNEEDGIRTWQKLCYVREDSSPWRYIISNIYQDFNIGCNYLDNLVIKMPKIEDGLNSNPFLKNIVEQKNKSNNKNKIIISKNKKY